MASDMAGHWRDGPLMALDTETTSADPEVARLVSAAVLLIHGSEVERRSWIIDPGIDIPAEAAAIHGLTTEIVRVQGRPFAAAVPEILGVLRHGIAWGAPIIAFNAAYDLTVLDREARRLGLAVLEPGYLAVDPFIIDKTIDRFRRGSRKLIDVAAHYGVPLEAADAHAATADALATARLAYKMAGHSTIAAMSLPELHAAQITWRREQAQSLAEYDARAGIRRAIQAEWPLIPFRAA